MLHYSPYCIIQTPLLQTTLSWRASDVSFNSSRLFWIRWPSQDHKRHRVLLGQKYLLFAFSKRYVLKLKSGD